MVRAIGAGSVVLAAVVGAGVAQAMPMKCARPDEVSAIQAAAVQQELMVAALTCNQITNFNAFQTSYNSELRSSDGTLERMFKRLFGYGAGEAQYHAFKTRLANDSSIRSIRDNPNYCKEAQLVFAAALTPEKPTLASFVAGVQVSEDSPVDSCEIRVAMGLQGTAAGPAIVPKPNPLRVAAMTPPAPPAAPAPAAAVMPQAAAVQTAPAAPSPAPATTASTTPEPGVLPDDDSTPPPAQTKPPEKKSSWLPDLF